jgi:putative membrane protein
VGVFTPLVVAMIAFAFYSLDSIGAELEEPFGLDPSDLPLAQISRMIEINLLQRAGAAELPSPLMPVRGVIL